jgi:hypothetical protein
VPDLTTIAERRGGRYPSDEIAQIVDGRKPVQGHLAGEMTRWGAVLERMEAGDKRAAKVRLDALVAYLESLQRKR